MKVTERKCDTILTAEDESDLEYFKERLGHVPVHPFNAIIIPHKPTSIDVFGAAGKHITLVNHMPTRIKYHPLQHHSDEVLSKYKRLMEDGKP